MTDINIEKTDNLKDSLFTSLFTNISWLIEVKGGRQREKNIPKTGWDPHLFRFSYLLRAQNHFQIENQVKIRKRLNLRRLILNSSL